MVAAFTKPKFLTLLKQCSISVDSERVPKDIKGRGALESFTSICTHAIEYPDIVFTLVMVGWMSPNFLCGFH